MTMVLLPITLTTASVLALLCLVLALRCGIGRAKNNVLMGDGGNADMIVRMRTQANFGEYVPILLILMGLLELGGGNRLGLTIFGIVLVVARIMHAVGMPRPVPNFGRSGGALVTFILLVVAAVYGLILTWFAWSPTA
jgi:uncharacterized membrane protein YecN with MAPEG domain